MQVTIDRIDGDKVVLELLDMTTVIVPLNLFPEAKEGEIYNITIDNNNSAKQKIRIQDKFNKLKEE